MNKLKNFRIAICEHTKKEIVQIKEPNGAWLCLHYENEILDKASIDGFKAGYNIREAKE